MKCDEVREYLHDYLDNELSYSLRQALDEHFVECLSCQEVIESYRKLRALLQLRTVSDPGKEYWLRSWIKIKKALPARSYAIRIRTAERMSEPAQHRQKWVRHAVGYAAVILFMVLTFGTIFLFNHTAQTSHLIANRDSEYILIYDEQTEQEILVKQTIPSELQPDFAFAAYTRAAFGGFDPVSKGMGLMMVEAVDK